MNQKKMNMRSRANSFGYALNGLYELLKTEPNVRIHAIATVVVIAAGLWQHLSPMKWVAISTAIGMVWITEAINTAVEKLCDLWCENKWHPEVKLIKDVAAGAVLIAAIISIVIGVFVFFF